MSHDDLKAELIEKGPPQGVALEGREPHAALAFAGHGAKGPGAGQRHAPTRDADRDVTSRALTLSG